MNELIKLPWGSGSEPCWFLDYWDCKDSSCASDYHCQLQAPSAYANNSQWVRRQISSFGYLSVNTIPTCNWMDGSQDAATSCAFTSVPFLFDDSLRAGTYTAKYILIADAYSRFTKRREAKIRLNIVRKNSSANGGTIDLNLILVGSDNIRASRTLKGQQNLNMLLARLASTYDKEPANIRLRQVNVVEWDCQHGGDAYANVDVDALGDMFQSGSALLPAGTEMKALNIFLVTSIVSSSVNGTILGVSGGISGPAINGTGASGLAFTSLNSIAKFNPSCTDPNVECPLSKHEPQFVDMATTIAHEMGHYLGLSHTSERTAKVHDELPDTPICTQKKRVGNTQLITPDSCQKDDANRSGLDGRSCAEVCKMRDGKTLFCPEQKECPFNHLMWWSSKGFDPASGKGDGNILSPESAMLLHYSPFVQ